MARVAAIILACVLVISMFYPKYQEYAELENRQVALEEEYRRDRERMGSERDGKIRKIRERGGGI